MARTLLNDQIFPVRESELELTIPADPDAVYHIRAITVDVVREVSKRHTRQVPNKVTHQREEVTDKAAVYDELLDYCLTAWEGMTGNPPCDQSNKRLLPPAVQAALVERAQIGQVTPEAKAASFREPADVVPVLGR